MEIPRYTTLAERPVLGKISVAEAGPEQALVAGLDAHTLATVVGSEVRAFDGDTAGFHWEALNGSEPSITGQAFAVSGSGADVMEKIRYTVGAIRNVDLATVFIDWN